jgi:hypothetical protein
VLKQVVPMLRRIGVRTLKIFRSRGEFIRGVGVRRRVHFVFANAAQT